MIDDNLIAPHQIGAPSTTISMTCNILSNDIVLSVPLV